MNKDCKFTIIEGWKTSWMEFGAGPKLIFAFHGYGQSASVFKIFEKTLGAAYTIISFDLSFHGELLHAENPAHYFSRENLKIQIEYFLNARKSINFSVLGYSLGGKLALNCIEIFPQQIEKLILMAPDGIKINPFYKFVTHTLVGNKIYHFTIIHPGIIFIINKLSLKLGFINQRVFQFVKENLESKEKRKKVFDSWLVYSRMLPNIKLISKLINEHQINVKLFFGKHDSIIPVKKANKLIKKLKNKNVIEVLDTGHNLFTEHEKIAQFLLKE